MNMIIFAFILIISAIILKIVNPGKQLRKKYQNDPENAFIYVCDGNTEIECLGKRILNSNKGYTYEYTHKGKKENIIVPKNYPYSYLYSRRKIYVNDGEIVSFNQFGESTEFSKDDINTVLESQIHFYFVKSIKGKSMGGFMMLILGLLIGSIAIYAFLNVDFKPNQSPTQTIDTNIPLAE